MKSRTTILLALCALLIVFCAASRPIHGQDGSLVISKGIACAPLDGDCSIASSYSDSAVGIRADMQLPGFCYRITITNTGPGTLNNVQLVDDKLDLSGCSFPTSLPAGGSSTCFVLAEHDETTLNTVTAEADADSGHLVANASATASVFSASLSCDFTATSPDDEDGTSNDNHVTLPDDGQQHQVTFALTVTAGDADLKNVTFSSPALEVHGCVMPPQFSLAANSSTNVTLCTLDLSCADLPLTGSLSSSAEADSSAGACGLDINGQPITVQTDCAAVVECAQGNQPPVALCQDVTVDAGSNCEAIASVDNGSYDPDGGGVTLSQSPPGPYPLGDTSVTLTVTDDQGATTTCTATVTVVDLQPPVLGEYPKKINESATSPSGAVVTFASPTLADNCPGAVVDCSPPSGSTFPVGRTQVNCTAMDSSGNTSACSFEVKINKSSFSR